MNLDGKWTQFMDMSSGGYTKFKDFSYIYVQGDNPYDLFERVTDENPYSVACQCCGENYSVTEDKDLFQATGYERNCKYDNEIKEYINEPDTWYNGKEKTLQLLEDYIKEEHVLLIFSDGTTNKEI